MKDVIIIDSTLPSVENSLEYILNNLSSIGSSLDIIYNKVKDLEFDIIILFPQGNEKNSEEIKKFCRENKISHWTVKEKVLNNADLYKNLDYLVCEKSIDNIILFYIDSPLIDIEMLKRLYNNHKENLAEYTFGDNFAPGIVPEIMSGEFINKIKEYKYKKPDILSRKVFDCINADINKFFIELEIAEYDFSLMRVDLTASSLRNYNMIKNLLHFVDVTDGYKKFYEAIQEHPEILFIFPRYIEIEITNNDNLNSILSPRSKMQRKIENMDFNLYKKIINELTEQYDDVIVSFTLMGEPLCHPQLLDFIDYALNKKNIFTLIIETNGILINQEIIQQLSKYPPEKLILLFIMDSIKQETYYKLNKIEDKDAFNKVMTNIMDFLKHNDYNKFRTFVQIRKVKENNLEIEDFYNFWKSKGAGVIIQKYNHYLNTLEDRSVVDLTPLDRQPCWHLLRDMEIFVNGDIPVCKQDFNGKMILGNAGENTIKDIWDKLKEYYILNYKEKFDKINICTSCDEWYTYNF